MKKIGKGKILLFALFIILMQIFIFNGRVEAYWRVSTTSYENNKNSINKYGCKNSPKIHLIVRGREIEPEDILFDGNEPNYREVVHSYSHSVNPVLCDSYLLPDDDTVTNVHKLTNKINYVEHKYTPIWNVDGYGIIAWYDNPEFEGEPVKSVYMSRRNDYSNEDRYYYAKTGKIIDIYYNGIKRQVVVGKLYSPIYLDLEYDAIAGTYSNAEYNVGFSQYTEDIPYDVSVKAKIAYYSDDNYFTRYGNKYFRNVAYTQHESRIKLETGSHIYIDSTDSLPFIDVDSMRYDSFKEGTQKYTQATIIDVETGEHADMSELHVTEHEPIKVTFELPNYHEYLGALDQNGNEYPAVIEMKQEYEGKVFTPVIGSDEVCTDYTVEYPPHAGLPGYYGYDNIHRLGVQLLTDFDNRYMPTLLSTTPETTLKEGYTISHISSCTPYDVYTKVHLYIDPSLLPDYAIVLNNKEITRVTRNTVYKLPEEAETKPAEVFTVKLKYQDGTTADETLAYTKTYTPTGFVIDGVHYDFGEEILVTRNLYIETDYEEEITGPELPSPTRNKYTFKGWFDMTVGGYRVYEIKDKTYKTLYAQWADKDYVIVTRPDGISIELERGSEYIIPEVPEKEDEAYSRVKFVYNDGTERSEVAQGIKHYEKNGIVCKETGQHYDVGQKIIVNENMTLQGNYIEHYYGVKFPVDPEWTDHTFLGWFDQIEDGFRYTMYSGRKDITLYAQWTDDTEDVTIYYADGNNYSPFAPYTDRVKRGDPYRLLNGYYRINNSLATFIYQDGITPDYVTHFSSDAWTARWIIDGKYYDMGETIIADSDKVIHADFVKTYSPVEFPEDPVRVGYTFLGWFDDPVNGTKYTKVDNRDNDIKLYAHWQRLDEEYTLPEIPAKNPETVATVTLKFQDNLTKDKQKYVKKNYIAVDYTVNGSGYNNEHFNVGDTINLTDDVTITPNYREEIVPVELYSATRDGYFFIGWYDTAEEEGGTKYTTYSGTSDITLYARWTTEIISTLCKRATTLHTDSKGVPYGNIPEAGILKVGDAFDCDVNGDGVYDAETERFYYVNDFYDVDTGEYDHNIAALIYYTDYMGRPITDLNDQTFTKWNNSDIPNEGPTAARSYLPTTEDWPNAHLYKTMRYPGGKSNKVGPIDELDYSGYSARMLSKKEVTDSGCVFNYNIKQKRQYFNFNHSCDFLGENIRYNNSGKQPAERGYWLDNHGGYCKGTEGCEDPRPYAWNLIMNNRQSYGLNGEFWDGLHIQMRETYYERGVRPVIDVPRNQIEDNPAENVMHTITFPEGTVQDVIHGGTFMFGNVNTSSTVNENLATVTFKYQDGETADTTSAVKKTKIPTAYKIGNTRYDQGSLLLVLQDYQLEYIYVDTIQPAKFPSDPTRAGYTFKGWYDSQAGGNKYTSYSDDEDITLYARWEGGSSEGYYTITYPNGDTEQVLAGTEWTFPVDNSTKDDGIFTVTFKYHNELEDTTSNVIAQYIANGWKIDEDHYNDGDVITVNHDITLEYDYIVTTIPAEFPSFNYNSDEYIFEGWFTAAAGGNKVTSYDKPEDITLHAHWSEVNPSQPELYNLGFNTETKPDEIISTVTFKYHNDSPDTTGNVIKYYVPNGWLVDGERYPNNTNIMKTSKTVIEPCFDDFIKPVSFPTNPTKQGYEFVGWFTSDSYGEQVTVYKGTQDITLHAQYTNNYALLITGRNFYSKVSSLISSYTYSAPGLTFRKANQNEYDSVSSSLTSNNIISLDDSPNEVYVWLSGTDILYYSTADVIYMNSNSSRMFDGLNKIGVIDLSGFNSSKVTDMWKMFNNCTRLTSLNLGNFDTSNVRDMSYMFYSCRALTGLGLSNFNTSNVTNMSYMFYGCEKITSLDLSNFDTSKVTNMSNMFYNCKVLASLDVSNFDTSNVTDLSYMFYNCQILTNIDVSSFDTSEVTTTDSMFYACKKLASLDLSSFNTSKVTDMTAMFYDCESLTSLDVSHFDTSKVTDMDLMFTSCLKVPTLDLSSFDTSSVTKMGSMFFNCFELETIYVSERWNVDAVTTSTNMFSGTTKIVGQKGTTYDRNHIDKTYAIIDDAPEHPGYLTYKSALPPAPAAYTITYPDGYVEIVSEGTEWIFPDLPESKSVTVTFDYNYKGTTPYVTEFHKGNIYNAWLIDVENGNSYNAGDTYIVNSNIVLSYDIEENTGSVEFPEDPTREDYEFKGWYDTNAAAGGNKYTEYDGEEDITLYARWKKNSSVNILCKKATTLHTIDCDNTNSYCNAHGVNSITYGNIGTGDTLRTGDAFTCDVNGDRNFDEEYERFYYVSDYYDTHEKAFNNDYAALVSAYNYIDGSTTGGHNYNLDGINVDGPSSRTYLPSTSDWSNTTLLESNRVIHIKTDSYHPDAYPEFDYEGRAARLLTFEEVRNGCGVAVSTPGYLDNCLFLLENTTFGKDEQDISGSIMTDLDKYSSVYLENNNVEYSDTYVYALDSDTRAVNTMMVSSWYGGIRPTIDVPKSRIGESDVTYTITYPDGTTEEVPAGTEFVFPTNSSTKEKTPSAVVTFKYNDGVTPDYISYVGMDYTAAGWKIGTDHYNDGDIYIVNSDITLAYDYVEIQSGAEFPSNPTREGYTFKGWYDSPAGGDKYTSYNEAIDITLYAHWDGESVQEDVLCKRATTLHTKTCESSYCSNEAINGIVTYGNLGQNGILSQGDAFDCDVNGDGYFDEYDERFYYVSDYFDTHTKQFDDSYAALIYSHYVLDGEIYDGTDWIVGYNNNNYYEGPTIMATHLPTTENWSNVTLKETTRSIINNLSQSSNPHEFSYDGYAARLLTVQEIFNSTSVSNDTIHNSGDYITERIYLYENSSYDTHVDNYFTSTALETFSNDRNTWDSSQYGGVLVVRPDSEHRNITIETPFNEEFGSVRPVIDVPKNRIEGSGYPKTYTITYPDGSTEVVPAGTEFKFPSNVPEKDVETIATVTFKLQNGSDDIVLHIEKQFTPNGWKIGTTHYDSGSTYIVNSDITLAYDYVETQSSIEFPSDPTRAEYTFLGWFTEETEGEQVTSYDGEEDITLYAHWQINTGCRYLGVNDIPKDDTTYTVTFKFENGQSDVIREGTVSYLPQGWVRKRTGYKDTYFKDKQYICIESGYDVFPYYSALSEKIEYPEDPTKEGYTFDGWYDSLTGGKKYDYYNGTEDITLYAHWKGMEKYVLPVNNQTKASEVISTVTFKYHNGAADTTSNVLRTYKPNGWLVDGKHYANGETIYKNDSTVIEPYFESYVANAVFPTNPTKSGYEFVGWFTEEEGGNRVTVLRSENDLVLHAQYTDDYSILKNAGLNGYLGLHFEWILEHVEPEFTDGILRFATREEFEAADPNDENTFFLEVSTTDSPKPTYMWYGGDGKVLVYSEAKVVFANKDMSYAYQRFVGASVSTFDLSWLNTTKVTNMSNMFYYQGPYIKEIIFGDFDTHNVTNMSALFNSTYNYKIPSEDLQKFDTSKVTNMRQMFRYHANKIDTSEEEYTLDLSSFDTRNVTTMEEMFYGCETLTGLNLSSFDTGKVTTMKNMFYQDKALKELDITNFNTSKVTDMGYMFYYLKLPSLDVSHLDTSSVKNMSYMFGNCFYLESLDVSNFDTSKVENMQGMFKSIKLETLDLSSFDTSSVTKMSYMFQSCSSLIELDLSSFDTHNVTTMEEMFSSDSKLTTIYVSDKWNTDSVTSHNQMFGYDYNLTGQKGTKCWSNDNPTDKTFARVDDAPETPGYLTYYATYDIVYPLQTIKENKNTYHTVRENTMTKNVNNSFTITFNPQNGDDNTVVNASSSYLPAGWIDSKTNIHYNEGDRFIVNEDVIFYPDFVEMVSGADFPADPIMEGKVFAGWFTDPTDGELVKSITEAKDITLYAHWIDNESGEINLGVNNIPKEDTTSLVTFRYQDNVTPDAKVTIVKQYIPNGWLVDGQHKDDNTVITYEEGMVIEPDYVETVVSGEWPTDPTWTNYTFQGWFDSVAGGNKYTINDIKESITLYAHWYFDGHDTVLCRRRSNATGYTEGIINTGDEFECDVDGDGNYEGTFYYVSDYYDTHTNSFVNEYAAMIYSSNIDGDQPVSPDYGHDALCYATATGWNCGAVSNGPTEVIGDLPTISQWSNTSLYQVNRNILTVDGSLVVENFSYNGYAARLLTVQEINEGCGLGITSDDYDKYTYAGGCGFLSDHLQDYVGPTDSVEITYYLENPIDGQLSSVNPLMVNQNSITDDPDMGAGARPVIDVPKERIFENVKPANTYTVTYADGHKETVPAGTDITIPENKTTKPDVNGAKVTFKPENGGSDIIRYVTKKTVGDGYTISNTHYDSGSTYTVNSDITLVYDYRNEYVNVKYPENIIKAGYDLEGWYTEAEGQGTKVSSYNGTEDKTLYANWTKKTSGEYTLPENTIGKDPEDVATVTFVYLNGRANTTSKVVATYTPNGWLVDGQPKKAGDVITMTPDTVLEPAYIRTVSPAAFPANPTRTDFVFKGWVDVEDYNSTNDYNYYISYDGEDDLTLYAKWETDANHCSITYSDGEIKVVTCGTSVSVPSTINTDSETITFNYMTYWYDDMMDYTETYSTSFNRTFYTKASVESYKVGNTTYNPGESFTVDDDIYVERTLGNATYDDEPFEEPDEAYNFVAWFTDWYNGVQVKSYYDYKSKGLTGELYGHYTNDENSYEVTVDGSKVGTYDDGYSYTAPDGTNKDEDLATVTLINGETTNTYKVHRTGSFSNYKVEKNYGSGLEDEGTVDAGSTVTINAHTFLTSQYDPDTVTGVELPVLEDTNTMTFKGWYKNQNGSGARYSGTYTDEVDITLYAYYEGKSANVTYYSDRTESASVLAQETYKYGDTVNTNSITSNITVPGNGKVHLVLQNGTTEGDEYVQLEVTKEIDHWLDNDENSYNKIYTVDFVGSRAFTPVYGNGTVTSYTLPTPASDTYPGYSFAGWYTEPQGGSRITKITEDRDITVYAHWTGNNDPVCIYTDGHTEVCNPGDVITVPSNYIKTVSKVYEVANGIDTYRDYIYNTISVEKYYIVDYYVIDGTKYYPGDTYTIESNTTNIETHYDEGTIPPVSLDEYVDDYEIDEWFNNDGVERLFTGWYTERTGGNFVTKYAGEEDLFVYGHYEEDIPSNQFYEVTFIDLYNNYTYYSMLKGTPITLEPEELREGGSFYLDPANGDDIIVEHLYASVTLSDIDVNGVLYHPGDTVIVNSDLTITAIMPEVELTYSPEITNPVKEGYVFTGWYNNDDRIDIDSLDFNNAGQLIGTTLVAHYEEYNPQTDVIVDFDGEIRVVPKGTTENLPTTGSKTNDTFTITLNSLRGETDSAIVSREYTLTGFTVNGELHGVGSEVTYIVDTTIRSQYDINYDYAGNYPVEYPDLPDISSIFSDFIGWYDAVTGGNEYEDASEITDTITLYARYTPKYNLTVDGVTTIVPEGYVYTVPEGTITGDYITFDLDYDYDDIVKTVKVGRGKGVKYQTINGVRYDANATYTVYSDTTVVTVNNSSNMVVMDPYIETPTRDGYVFIEWRYNGDGVNIYSITPDDVYFDGATLEARWDEFDPETQVYVRCIDKFLNIETTDILPKGTTRTLQNIPANDSFNATISNNLDDTVINATFTTVAPVSYLTLNGEVHYPGEQYTYNENTVGEVFRDVTTTTECDGGECPSILYQKPNTEVNGYLFKGLFSTQNLDKPVDFSKIYAKYGTNMNDFYSEMILMYQSMDDSIILTVDDEVSIIPKGMGTIPEAKTKASDIYKVTYDYNDGTSRKVYDNIVARYTFDHYNVVGKGEYEAGAAYNYLENTTMNSVFTKSVEFPEIKTIKTENFIGWFTEPHGGVEVTTLEGIERDITLYARYNNEHVTIYIDNVANPVLYGEEFTLPAGTSKSDKSITFTLDYNYDNRIEDYTISTSYEFTGYEMDGNNYEAGYTFEATEDKYVTSKYNLTNEFTPEYTEPDREGYVFNGWFDGNEKVNVSGLTADSEEIDGKTLIASWTEVSANDVIITYDGETRVVPIGTKLSELGDSPIKPSAETFTVYIDRNNGSFIIDEYEITKSYSLDKVYINDEELNENDYTFNEDATVTTTYTANYEPNIFEGLSSDISGIFTEAVGGVKVENYDNVNDGDTLYYQYGETHTITVDGEVIATVPHGAEYSLPVNSKPKAIENIAEVTFDYGDDRDPYVTYVRKRYNANGWSINGEPYSNNEKIIVNEDIVLDREYYETVQGVDFPRTPKRSNYRFDGWYYNNEVITSYNGDEDITINANWIKQIVITYLDDGTVDIVDTGTTMVFDPKEDKEEEFHNITFKYNYEGCPEDKVVRISSHDHFIGWLVNSTDEYDDGDEITFVNNSTVKARYEKVISNKNLPEDPVRDGYDFLGWYDGKNIENSNKVDITKVAKTMTVYGQYKVSGEHVVFFDGTRYTYTDATSVDTESEGFISDTKENVVTLTLDYQNPSIDNESIAYTISSEFVNWTDENGETYGKVVDLTNVPDGMHFTSNYVTDEFTPVDLNEFNPDVNDFIGWFTDRVEGEQVVTYDGESNATYYAHYGEIKQVVVTIDNEVTVYSVGETFNLPASKSKADDEIVITFDPQNGEESFTRSIVTSYTFTGFRLVSDNVLYAGETQFTANEDMTFNSEYTSSTVGATWPEDPEKENYAFLGWYTHQEDGMEVFNFDGITSNTSLYAHYTTDDESFVTLTNTVTGESLKVQKSTDWLFNESKFNKDNKEKLGTITYKFNSTGYPDEVKDYYRTSTPTGYYIEGDDTLYNIDEAHQFTSDTNITPYYGNVITDSHVGIDQFDYEVTNGNKQARCFSKIDQNPEDTHDDEVYTCYENYDENDGNVTVYLHWRELGQVQVTDPDGFVTIHTEGDEYDLGTNNKPKNGISYTVTFDYQDGRENTTGTYSETYTNNGFLVNGTHYDDGTVLTLTEDIVIERDYTYSQTTITLPEPERQDYTFIKWNSETDGSGTTYTSSNINKLTSDTTAYAIWASEDITLSFVTDGDEQVSDITVAYDTPIGDVLPTSSKANERTTVGEENIITGYIFDGWYREDTYENKVSSASKFTEDTTLYAKFIEDNFPYVYPKHEESFVCTGSNYIDTGIKLYTDTNNDYLKDYEVGFTIESYTPSGQAKQVTFFNAKWENQTEQWPGVAFRRYNQTNSLEVSQSNNKVRVGQEIPNYTLPLEVRIYRINNVIYYSVDGGATKNAVQDITGFDQFFDINAYFCAGDNGSGGVQRYVKATISNYYINMGKYQGTVDNQTTHTVTYPDSTVETYYHNSIVELEANEESKASDNGAQVTFDYNDGVTASEIRYVTRNYTPNGFMVNGTTHYDDYSTLVVDEDKVLTNDYITENVQVEFPSNPTREHYTFDGWYDEDGNEVRYYDGDDNITLYAHWTGALVPIITPLGREDVEYGTDYTIPNDIDKNDDVVATVTFKYHNGDDDTTSDVVKSYTQTGWKDLDDVSYESGQVITVTHPLELSPVYEESITGATWPADPTRENADFLGWFTEQSGGVAINEYAGTSDITVHAQWDIALPTDFDLDADDLVIVKGETHQIEVTFIPDESSDTLTYTSSDDDIATVSDEGLITAVEKGVITIIVSADNADIDKVITVTVVSDKLESDEYEVRDDEFESDTYRIVIGAEALTTIGEFKDNMLNDNEYIKIYDLDNNELTDDDIVMTGLIIKLEINGVVHDEATMVVRGDVDGDGIINVSDLLGLINHIRENTLITEYPKFAAANVDEDEILNVSDQLKLNNYLRENIDSLNE